MTLAPHPDPPPQRGEGEQFFSALVKMCRYRCPGGEGDVATHSLAGASGWCKQSAVFGIYGWNAEKSSVFGGGPFTDERQVAVRHALPVGSRLNDSAASRVGVKRVRFRQPLIGARGILRFFSRCEADQTPLTPPYEGGENNAARRAKRECSSRNL